MVCRISHCGSSIENYHLCLTEKVAGFTKRVGNEGDTVYFAVRFEKKTYCGGKAILSLETDFKPWGDAERYVQCFTLKDVEFCEPFDLSVLSEADQYWAPKYLMGAKEIKESLAVQILEKNFLKNKTKELVLFDSSFNNENQIALPLNEEEIDEEEQIDDSSENISIMGTFQTIKFVNESDKKRGLEKLVTDNFYNLFPHFPENRTILISENRKFKTSGMKDSQGSRVLGIDSIPDALLLVFNKDSNTPFQINLIEYECYGEGKTRAIEKFNYLNGHIIPQLMRFASTFSIVTDRPMREETIERWTEKIMDYIDSDDDLNEKVIRWIKEMNPEIKERNIGLKMRSYIIEAFKTNLRILLIIDELTDEQKETMKNIINSFKLDNQQKINFTGYVVRLEQKINLVDSSSEFALSVQ